jgi:hypothetical protein
VLKALRRMLQTAPVDTHAVAVLVHEARRADHFEGDEESVRGRKALAEMFALQPDASAALLEEGRARRNSSAAFTRR